MDERNHIDLSLQTFHWSCKLHQGIFQVKYKYSVFYGHLPPKKCNSILTFNNVSPCGVYFAVDSRIIQQKMKILSSFRHPSLRIITKSENVSYICLFSLSLWSNVILFDIKS